MACEDICGVNTFVSVNTMAKEFWSLGCFDIYIKEKCIYSKCQKKMWPSCEIVAKNCKNEFDPPKETADE